MTGISANKRKDLVPAMTESGGEGEGIDTHLFRI